MRVAVLADIHGNLPALDAVLDDIDAVAVDAIVLNGDLATGPMPAETLDRLAEGGEMATWVRGNADRRLFPPRTTVASTRTCRKRCACPPSTAHPAWAVDTGICLTGCHCRSPRT